MGFYSTVFPTPKSDGTVRVILNAKKLNEFLEKHHFKMDTIKDAIQLMQPDCYFASIDFKHAYFSVSVDVTHRCYLKFYWKGRIYQFTVLPQGVTSAPLLFTKLLKPPFAYLRERGFIVLGYIDDTLFVGDEAQEITNAVTTAVHLFDNLGLTVHIEKSVFQPTHCIQYLGFILNSTDMTVSLTVKKKEKIRHLAQQLFKCDTISIREFASFIGTLVAMDPGVYGAPLFYKGLEIVKAEALVQERGNYNATISLPDETKLDIQWWIDNIMSTSKAVTTPSPTIITESDASSKGWGLFCHGQRAWGDWSVKEAKNHINWLELKAALFALQTFYSDTSNTHIRLMIDNTTAVACINKMGSTKRHLFQLVREIYQWAMTRKITLSAMHIPGRLNVRADKKS